jgi:3',5'-cyclic AMP phosphodiesterase CpdA
MDSTTLGILHLTDLHAGQPGHSDVYPHMLEGLLNDLEATHRRSGPWDLVVFSGDLAFSGEKSEFELVEGFRKVLGEHLAS